MASILDKFGIKEVGDVTFYHLTSSGKPDYPVLYLDTCKVTSLEQSADEVEAKGGKGNVSLMVWDTNKQLTVNLEDALFSTKSMAIMFGNGTAQKYGEGASEYIMKSEQFTSDTLTTATVLPRAGVDNGGWSHLFVAPDGQTYEKINPKFYDENGDVLVATAPEAYDSSKTNYAVGDSALYTVGSGSSAVSHYMLCIKATTAAITDPTSAAAKEYWVEGKAWAADKVYFCSYDLAVDGAVISIDKDSFPGSYYVTIDTYARMQGSGEDDFFQLIMPNCKVQSSNTISMSADGDPSTLTMNLKVQKPANGGAMVYMVKYGLTGSTGTQSSAGLQFAHNHELNGANA